VRVRGEAPRQNVRPGKRCRCEQAHTEPMRNARECRELTAYSTCLTRGASAGSCWENRKYGDGPLEVRPGHRNLLDASRLQNHVLREQNCQI
jgi:hypothetical protein